MIALADLVNFTEEEVIYNLSHNYSGEKSGFDYGEISENDIIIAKKMLQTVSVLIAYESVGNWGCDSNAFYLLQDKITNELFEVHASHCSCYGFEGQLDLEPTTIEALKYRAEKARVFFCGGYDENDEENQRIINEYILSL